MLRQRITTPKNNSRAVKLKSIVFAALGGAEHLLHVLLTCLA
jgi:hypothetical protein